MKKVFDNIEEFNERLRENEPETAEEKERYRLDTIKMVTMYMLKYSQFKRTPDPKKVEEISGEFYGILCKLAEECGGRVEFNYHESSFEANITYTGNDIYIGKASSPTLLELAKILLSASSLTISAANDNLFRISINFSPYKAEKIADYSKEIEELRNTDPKDLDVPELQFD